MCARCDELLERVAWLESELGIRNRAEEAVRLGFKLSPSEARILLRLYHAGGRLVTLAQLDDAAPAFDPSGDREYVVGRVYAYRLRMRMGGDTIRGVRGQGYHLSPEGVAAVCAVIQPMAARLLSETVI